MCSELCRLSPSPKTGNESFHANGQSIGFDLLSFWRWSCSDLVSNATRGRLAEFIVAKALGITTDCVRDEWGAYDLKMLEGIKVEVKSAAFVQSWHQDKLSKISFLTPKTREYNPDTNKLAQEQRRQADVYVFALLSHKDKPNIDPMNVSQWCFYVVPTRKLDSRTRSQHSITLPTLERLTKGPVSFSQLRAAVLVAAGQEPAIQ